MVPSPIAGLAAACRRRAEGIVLVWRMNSFIYRNVTPCNGASPRAAASAPPSFPMPFSHWNTPAPMAPSSPSFIVWRLIVARCPCKAPTKQRTSIARKLTAYEASWRANIFRQRFSAARVQILTVTTGSARLDSITACASAYVSAAGLFHFAAFPEIIVSPVRFLDSLIVRWLPAPPSTIVLPFQPVP